MLITTCHMHASEGFNVSQGTQGTAKPSFQGVAQSLLGMAIKRKLNHTIH
jgi:hypothetical protein